MATVSSAQDGKWSDTSTWTGGAVPTAEDDVMIYHSVRLYTNGATSYYFAKSIRIRAGGSLTVDPASYGNIVLNAPSIRLYAVLNDTRTVNLDGVILNGVKPTISSVLGSGEGFHSTPIIEESGDGKVLIDDPGFPSATSKLRDYVPEGIAHGYAEKVGNGVRYLIFTVKILYSELQYLRYLYWMTEDPYQVLVVTRSCVIKGFIESVVPDPSSVGKEYISVKVTITEGPGA